MDCRSVILYYCVTTKWMLLLERLKDWLQKRPERAAFTAVDIFFKM